MLSTILFVILQSSTPDHYSPELEDTDSAKVRLASASESMPPRTPTTGHSSAALRQEVDAAGAVQWAYRHAYNVTSCTLAGYTPARVKADCLTGSNLLHRLQRESVCYNCFRKL